MAPSAAGPPLLCIMDLDVAVFELLMMLLIESGTHPTRITHTCHPVVVSVPHKSAKSHRFKDAFNALNNADQHKNLHAKNLRGGP
jgi:hypothetical protein